MSSLQNKDSTGFYLPELDGLRFFAFLLVFLHHVPCGRYCFIEGSSLDYIFVSIKSIGFIGVDLFLCLSGYLITKLLSIEKEKTGTISVFKFYIRRALRIWPLYYFMLLCGFFIMPLWHYHLNGRFANSDIFAWQHHLLSYTFFFGNWSVAFYSYTRSHFLNILWTISLEEQFYVFWAPVYKKLIDNRKILYVIFASLILITLICRAVLVAFELPHPFIWVFTFTRLDSFVLGSFIAASKLDQYLISKNRSSNSLILWVMVFALTYIVIKAPAIGAIGYHLVWFYLVVALLMSSILLLTLSSNSFRKFLGKPTLVYLGKRSYGLYVYHFVAMDLAGVLFLEFYPFMPGQKDRFVILTLGQGFLGFVLVLSMAVVSYAFLERPFLLVKNKYSKIASRPV